MKRILLAILLVITMFAVPPAPMVSIVSADEPEPVELTDSRTATTKLWSLGNNQYRLESWINAVHYYAAGTSEWIDIDPDYYEDDSGDYTAIFLKLPYICRMGDDTGRRIYPDRSDLSYWIEFYKPFPNMGSPEKAGGYWYWNFPNSIIAVRVANNAVQFAFRLKNSDSPSSITIP